MFTYNYLYLYITRNYHTSVLVGQHLVYHDPTRASFHLAPRSRLVVRECSELSAGATGGREREAQTVLVCFCNYCCTSRLADGAAPLPLPSYIAGGNEGEVRPIEESWGVQDRSERKDSTKGKASARKQGERGGTLERDIPEGKQRERDGHEFWTAQSSTRKR